MVNKSLTFDCIWRLRSFSIGVSFSQSYYPQPVQYIRNTKQRKRWFLAIDRHGNLRNGNKTKGRRDSSVWRVSASTSHLNLSNDKHVVNAMMRDGLFLSSRTNDRPSQRVQTDWMGAPYFLSKEQKQQRAACSKIEGLLLTQIKEDLRRSQVVLTNTSATRDHLARLLAPLPPKRLLAFRSAFDGWVRMHWSTPYWKKRARCLRSKIKAQQRRRRRHGRGLDKEMTVIERHLRAWRSAKRRLLRFLTPLTFQEKRSRRVRLHELIRKRLKARVKLHAFKEIKWAVYVDLLYRPQSPKQRLLLKYGEAVRHEREQRRVEMDSCAREPRLPRPKLAFDLQRWHRHLYCIEQFDAALKKMNLSQLLRRSVEAN